MAGRPTKLRLSTIKRICRAIATGLSDVSAAAEAGICPATLYEWKRRGRENRTGIHARLLDAIALAEAQDDARLERIVGRYVRSKKDEAPKMALQILRSRKPDRYGDRLNVSLSKISREEEDRLRAAEQSEEALNAFVLDTARRIAAASASLDADRGTVPEDGTVVAALGVALDGAHASGNGHNGNGNGNGADGSSAY